MSTLTTFHLFPRLPSELRIKVYDFVLCLPRIVDISCKRERIKGTRNWNETFASQTAIPALLHTTHESRIEALKVYKPVFQTSTSPSYIYVSSEQDTIDCVDRVLQYLKSPDKEELRKMLVRVFDASLFCHFHIETVMSMSRLEELGILASQEMVSWSTDRTWVDGLINDVGLTKEKYPDWSSPQVRVMDKNTREDLGLIPRGPWIHPLV